MLVIRLSRTGRKNYATYRLVVADSRRSAKGKIVANVGHYNPHTKELVVKKDEVERYLSHGAQPSSAAVKLLQREKIALPKWAQANLVIKNKKSKAKAQTEEVQSEKPAAKAEPAAEKAESKSEVSEQGTEKVEAVPEAAATSDRKSKLETEKAEPESQPEKADTAPEDNKVKEQKPASEDKEKPVET